MDNIFDDEIDCKRILREVTFLRKLRHPFVVDLIEILHPADP
jgi:mitogen-activated protein kinase 1/3